MDTIKVRAMVKVLELDPGDEVDIEETDLIRGCLKNGYLQRVDECPDPPAEPPAEPPAPTVADGGLTVSEVASTYEPTARKRRGKDDGSPRNDQ